MWMVNVYINLSLINKVSTAQPNRLTCLVKRSFEERRKCYFIISRSEYVEFEPLNRMI